MAYFAAGAGAYGTAAAMPALTTQAMAALGAANVGLDAIHGSLPSLDNPAQTALYAVQIGTDMMGVSAAPGIANLAEKGLSQFSTKVAIEGSSKITESYADGFAVEGMEWVVTGSKTASGEAGKVVASLADDAVETGAKNLVYEGLDAAGTVRYVGITERDATIRFAEHLNSNTARSLLDYRVVDGATNLSRINARIWEQSLINQYGLGKNGGLLVNKINSIASKYWLLYGIMP